MPRIKYKRSKREQQQIKRAVEARKLIRAGRAKSAKSRFK